MQGIKPGDLKVREQNPEASDDAYDEVLGDRVTHEVTSGIRHRSRRDHYLGDEKVGILFSTIWVIT